MTKKRRNVCPLCGAQLPNANNGLTIVAAFIGKGIGGCTECPEQADMPEQTIMNKTAQERIEALREAGVDVSHLFAMTGANGGECVVSNKGGKLDILTDHDPIFSIITSQGTVPNRYLFRRFVMAQMFHMMSYTPHGQKQPLGVTEMIHRMGYEYQWKMLMNELIAQMKMQGKDQVNFKDRNRWFNVSVVTALANDYIEKLREYVDGMPVKHCKGIPYKRVGGRDIFVSDLQYKLFHPFFSAMRRIAQSRNAVQLYNTAKSFNDMRLKLPSETPQCKEWIVAYKGSGAYFTMQNLIRFHNCSYVNEAGYPLDRDKSLEMLSFKAEMYKDEGWRLLGVLKKMLEYNNINIKKKMAEWRKRKGSILDWKIGLGKS